MLSLSHKFLLKAILVLSLIGIADTSYLTSDFYFGTGVNCSLLQGCEVVLTSPYSAVFGIPLSLLGLIFYITVFILVSAIGAYQKNIFTRLLAVAGTIGFCVSLFLLYVQIFLLKEVCIYCLTSTVSSTTIFVFSMTVLSRSKVYLG